MRYVLIAALLFVQTVIACAQSEDASAANEKVRALRLDAKPYQAKGDALIRLSGIEVAPVCADTTQLGFMQVGMTGRKVRVVPDKPYTPFLQDFVNELFKNIYVTPGMHLLWVIKDLRINESSQEGEKVAAVRLKADAYLSTDQQHYRLLTKFDTVLVQDGDKHDRNIAEAIQLFYLTCEDAAGNYTGDTVMTATAIIAREQERFRAPVYVDTVHREGVYLSYKEFLANAPSVTDFDIVTKKKKVTVYAKGADSSRRAVTPWGVSMKGGLYKYEDKELLLLQRRGNAFVLSDYQQRINRRNRSNFWGNVAIALVDGVLTYPSGGSSYTNMQDFGSLISEMSAIDAESGELVF